ncbi:hypothetical protein WR25_11458 [Diploscapter pachys]|uniref:Uncharacterized protein n=1 Tax=Diploscapter pachys TaxID=2018661 RepID=A0A2A2J698_9BILA|nr:hypothetical protein WR25_11458 [Diploscapter pachys]
MGFQMENQRDFTPQTTIEDTSTAARAPDSSYMGRNHHGRHQAPPSFMRHGAMNHQQSTRLVAMTDSDVKHISTHSTATSEAGDDKAKVPRLVKDSMDME